MFLRRAKSNAELFQEQFEASRTNAAYYMRRLLTRTTVIESGDYKRDLRKALACIGDMEMRSHNPDYLSAMKSLQGLLDGRSSLDEFLDIVRVAQNSLWD